MFARRSFVPAGPIVPARRPSDELGRLAAVPHIVAIAGLYLFLPGGAHSVFINPIFALGVFIAIILWGPVRLLAWLGVLKPLGPELREYLDGIIASVGIPTRRLLRARLGQANALAFPITRDIVVTELAIKHLTQAEVGVVVSHELGHLNASRRVQLMRNLPVGVLYLLPLTEMLPPMYAPYGLLATLVLCIVVTLLVTGVARRDEQHADALASLHEAQAGLYARTLEKLYEANLAPAVSASRRAVHPNLYDRMLEAGVQPDYPRPSPPLYGLALAGGAVIALLAAIAWFHVASPRKPWLVSLGVSREHVALANITLGAARRADLSVLGLEAYRAREWSRADALFSASNELYPDHRPTLVNAADVAAALCDCKRAGRLLSEAQALPVPSWLENSGHWSASRAYVTACPYRCGPPGEGDNDTTLRR